MPQPSQIRVLVVVDSWSGHTQAAAQRVVHGVESTGAKAVVVSADEATLADLLQADAFMMGSAVHQRGMTWKLKRFVDEVCEPAWFYDHMVGRVGAVFSAGGGHGQAGGGAESAQLDMLTNLAACGMVLVTLPKCTPGFEHGGVHWGPTVKTTDAEMRPVSPEALDSEAMQAFFHHGANVARVAASMRGTALASGNRWPSSADREGRTKAEGDRDPNKRYPSAADPAAH